MKGDKVPTLREGERSRGIQNKKGFCGKKLNLNAIRRI